MSTNFPSSLDNSTTLPVESSTTPLSTNHTPSHQNLSDAVKAIEAKVGVDSSAVTTSHDYKLSEVTSTDKAVGKTATQTLTNKTLTAPIITSPKITVGSDAVGDLHYTSNVDGTQSRIAKGNDNQILKMNGSTINWEDEAVLSDASYATKGIVQGLTDAATSGLTIASGVISVNSGTSANKIVKLDSNGYIPAVDGRQLTNIMQNPNVFEVVASGTTRVNYSDSSSTTFGAATTAYTKFKEIVFTDVPGTIRCTWIVTIASGGTGSPYSKIYVNGSAVGAEKTTSGAQTESSITVTTGDLIQVYAHMTAGDTATYNIDTFRLGYDKQLKLSYSTNTVNM